MERLYFVVVLGLKFNGLINRCIYNDIDVFTFHNFYGTGKSEDLNRDSSGRFLINGQQVFKFSGRTPQRY